MLAASWIDDFGCPQNEMEPRRIFYNNESLLIEDNLRNHFSKKNIKTFYRQAQEFICLKGSNPIKQSYFIQE